MAKDVVFESEKYMQRQEAKRKWIPIVCFAAILLVIILIALFLRGNNGVVYTAVPLQLERQQKRRAHPGHHQTERLHLADGRR